MLFFEADNIVGLVLKWTYHQALDYQMISHYPKAKPLNLVDLQKLHNGDDLHYQL